VRSLIPVDADGLVGEAFAAGAGRRAAISKRLTAAWSGGLKTLVMSLRVMAGSNADLPSYITYGLNQLICLGGLQYVTIRRPATLPSRMGRRRKR
jgi:hypothetical protein